LARIAVAGSFGRAWARAAAVCLALLAAVAASPAPRPPQTAPRPDPVHSFGYVTVADGTRLGYTLYRPAAPGRFPTLLVYNMYDAAAIRPDWNQTATSEIADYLAAGYAVMGANVRGTGCSTGELDPLDAEIVGRDGAEVVEWIARQEWSDGRVGMFGHSGSGITQFYVAARNPPPLRAIIPGSAPDDMYRDLGYPGGLFNYVFAYQWAERAQPASSAAGARAQIDAGDTACAEWIKTPRRNRLFDEMRGRPLDDAWYARHSVYPVAPRIRVPTFVIFGWQDQSVFSGAIRVFDSLAGPRKMLLLEEGHNFYVSSLPVRREKIRFFDRWVKGTENDAMGGKPITVWLTTGGPRNQVPERTAQVDRIPVEGTRWTPYYMRKGGALETAPATEATTESYLYPAGEAYIYGGDAFPHVPHALGGLRFRTDPFAREVVLLGPTTVRLHVASTAEDTSLLVVLNEIDASGRRKYLQRGYLKGSMRETDPHASSPHAPRFPFRRSAPLRPGEVTALDVALHPTGSVIEAGHSLELVLAVPAMAPEPFGQWGFLPVGMGVQTLHMSPSYPSRVLLPVVELDGK
jgi:putative CocE/NonD family hydrolase